MRQLLSSVLFKLLSGAAAAAQTVVNGTLLDTAGFNSVTVIVPVGAVTAGGTLNLKIQGGDAADGSDLVDLDGVEVNATAADANKVMAIEIHRPKQRYLKAIVTRATQNSAIEGIHAYLYGASHTPVDNSALVTQHISVTSPDQE